MAVVVIVAVLCDYLLLQNFLMPRPGKNSYDDQVNIYNCKHLSFLQFSSICKINIELLELKSYVE